MFAVLKTGGKQYKVQSGDTLRVEKLAANAGDKVQFNEVLMLGGDSPVVGAPTVEDAGVQAEVIEQFKGPKTDPFRQTPPEAQLPSAPRATVSKLTLVRVTDILASGASASGIMAAVGAGSDLAVTTPSQSRQKSQSTQGRERLRLRSKLKLPKLSKLKQRWCGRSQSSCPVLVPALEKKLHAAGVTTFAQIAAWTEDDVADMDEKLSFKGRIEREGWIEQAKEKTQG